MHSKLSSLVSDLLGLSARRMLQALAEGEADPAAIAALADFRLRATPAQLQDALGAGTQLHAVYRRLLKMALQELELLEEQIEQLDREASELLQEHQDAVQRLAEAPGLGVSSSVQIIVEVGPGRQTSLNPPKHCPHGWGYVREAKRVRASRKARARRRATRICAGSSISQPSRPLRSKAAHLKSHLANCCRVWGTRRPSGLSRIDCAGYSGSFCVSECVTRNGDPQ